MSSDTAKLLSIIDSPNSITVAGISDKDLFEYTKKQIKDTYVKPPRKDGRPYKDEDEHWKIPLGVFNLGNNSAFLSDKQEREEDGEEDEDPIEVKSYIKMVDGKIVDTEENQPFVDVEEEELKFNLAAKNDIPYQIYQKIRFFGRLTVEELFGMYGAIQKEMLFIIIKDMLNKRYLKKVKEIERDVEFNENAATIEEFTKVTEKEIETLEITTEDERKQILEEKKN